MAPISHPDRYSHSIDFWRNVYGIDSKCYINMNFGTIITFNLIGILVKTEFEFLQFCVNVMFLISWYAFQNMSLPYPTS